MTAGPYDLAIRLSVVDGLTPVLAMIAGHMKGMQKHFDELTRAQKGLALGFAGVAGGALGVVAVFKEFAPAGAKLLDQQDKLQRAGMGLNDVLKVQASYFNDIAKAVPTIDAAGYLKTFNELRSVVGAEEAEKIAPWSAKLEAIIGNSTGKSAEGEGFKLWRAMEMTGRSISDVAGTQKLADALAKNIIGSGGKLDANIYQTMAKRAGVAWAKADPEFLAGPMSVVGADLGGDTAGTTLMSLYQSISGATTLSKQQAQVLWDAGMLKSGYATKDEGGRINVKPGGILGSEVGMHNPYAWVNDVLIPHLDQLYGGDKAGEEMALAKLGRNRNVTRILTMFSDPGFKEQIDKDLAQWKQAHSIDQSYADFTTRNPLGVQKAFWAQLESFKQAVGAPMQQTIVPFIKDLTGAITSLGAAANAHPQLAASLATATGGAMGGALMGGTVGMLGGPAGAAIGAALGAVVGGLTGLAIMNWDAIKNGLSYVKDAILGIPPAIDNFMNNLGHMIVNGVMAMPEMVLGAVKAAFKAISDMISSAISHIPGASFFGFGGQGPVAPKIDTPPPIEKHSSLVPPPRHLAVNIPVTLNVDSRRMAQTMMNHVVAAATFPTSASGADTRGTWMGPSYSPTEQG
ncbi:hypothetical protein RZS28_00600 [Methylocapsa polymorpha]|uniref:Uncharacterized protein n=1 Tax=Methylocapsa polymorpha TaxID=3080828 RepID=A0ABZ0HTH0_9HYPH|nr:hypothetical protein RZS28_00600 [Methylocapsa sp. RX1]